MLLAAGLFGPWGSVLRICAAFHPSVRTLPVYRRGACLTFFLTLMLSSATWLLFSSSAKGRGEILLRLQGRTHRRKKGRSKMSIIQEEAKGQSRREGTQLYIQG